MPPFDDRIVARSTGTIRGSVCEDNTFAVTRVHPGSVAAAAGVTAGMLYRPSNPAVLSPLALPERLQEGDVRSLFVDLAADQELEITTQGFPFGMELAKGPTALARDVLGSEFDVDALADLMHGGDHDAMGRFMVAVAQVQRTKSRGLGTMMKDWLGAQRGADARIDLDAESYMGLVPHLKIAAAFWLAAHGNASGAQQLLRAWEAWGVGGSGSAYAALYHLTVALVRESEAAAGGDVRSALLEAHRTAEDSPLVAVMSRDRIDQPLAQRRTLTGQRLPRDYRLQAFDPLGGGSAAGANFVSLSETCEGLGEDQRLLVIMLGAYRANGFYSRILYRFQELFPVLGPRYPQVHVVTSFEAGGRHNPEWLVGEVMARRRGADITVLHDLDGAVGRALMAERSPQVYIVDRARMVRYDGFMPDEGGFWQGLEPLVAA